MNIGNPLYNTIDNIVWFNIYKPAQTTVSNNKDNPDTKEILDRYIWENISRVRNTTMSALWK